MNTHRHLSVVFFQVSVDLNSKELAHHHNCGVRSDPSGRHESMALIKWSA